MPSKWEQNEEIQIFREYLKIPSAPTPEKPDIDYGRCIEFLKKQAVKVDLPYKIFTPGGPTKPIFVMEWAGQEPQLPTILLNSHMDVVPVFEQHWCHPPFAADIDAEGRIFARGSQDMKCVGMQYLAAIRKLKCEDIELKRTVFIMFTPDEETGGILGMKAFVPTKEFKCLNIGFALDEGAPAPDEVIPFYIGERAMWRLKFKITGTSGHGSLLCKNTVGEKVCYLLNKFMEYRTKEICKLEANKDLTVADVTTINLTVIKGGIQDNVVPNEMYLVFDIRLALDVDQNKFEEMINKWMEEAGGCIEIKYHLKDPIIPLTSIENNPFYDGFKCAMEILQLKTKQFVCPGGTDSRHLREVCIPAIGFSPMPNTPFLLHNNDEFLQADTYLKGIEIYKTIIEKIGNA